MPVSLAPLSSLQKPLSPGLCGWGWGRGNKTSHKNLGSSFSIFLIDFSKAQFLKCHQKFPKFQNWFNAKGGFCAKKADGCCTPFPLSLLLNGCWKRHSGLSTLIPTEKAVGARRHRGHCD